MFALPIIAFAALLLGDPPAPSKGIGIEEALRDIDPSVRPPKRFALVLGVADYQDNRIVDLPACERDARDLAATLLDPAAGLFAKENLTLLVNGEVTRNTVVAALDTLARRAGPDDLVVVFFSGHGATDEKGRAYWVMSDTKVDQLRATAMPEVEITELLGEIKTRRLVTLIDACYSAATANVSATKSLVDLSKVYPSFKGDGRVGITASKGDQLSMVINDAKDPGFGHSAFTYHLIEGLRGKADAKGNGDGVIELDELWNYVKDRTIETARLQGGNQEPQLKGQLGSRFLLAVDGPRLEAIALTRRSDAERDKVRLETLRSMFAGDEITAAQFEEAKVVLNAPLATLTPPQRSRRDTFVECADGRLPPKHLASVLASIDAAPASPSTAVAPAMTWPDLFATTASRFTEIEAPVAIVFDVDACDGRPELSRFARAAARWPVNTWSTDTKALPRSVGLIVDPLPETADTTLLVRGAVRETRSDALLASLLVAAAAPSVSGTIGRERVDRDGAVSARIAPRCVFTLLGDPDGLDRLLDRSVERRPAWRIALASASRDGAAVAGAADGLWFVERLARIAPRSRGGFFVGKVWEDLALPDPKLWEEDWQRATNRLTSVSASGTPNGEWLRCTVRLTFLEASDVEIALPGWASFSERMSERFGAEHARGLDTQRDGTCIVLRCEVNIASLAAWIDRSIALPGSLLARPDDAAPVTPTQH